MKQNNSMTAMITRKRIPQAVLLLFCGVALVASSHLTVEASISVRDHPLRRVPRRKVRGIRRELGIGNGESPSYGKTKVEGKKTRSNPSLPEITRPVPIKISKLALDHDVAKGSSQPEEKLPEPSQQGVEIKIKKDSGEHPKTGETHPAPKNDKFIENGLEHFQEGKINKKPQNSLRRERLIFFFPVPPISGSRNI